MAIQMSRSELEKIGLAAILDTSQFQSGMTVYMDGLRAMETKTDQAAKGAAKSTEDMADKQKKATEDAAAATEQMAKRQAAAAREVSIAFAAVGAAGVALLTAFVMTASRAEELGVILDVTAENARRLAVDEAAAAEAEGDMAKATAASTRAAELNAQAVNAQVKAVKAQGVTTATATKLVAQMIRYQLDWTKSTELAALAQDAATFAAQDSSDALEGLIHGITTLNPRVLRTYGILVNLEDAYQRWGKANNVAAADLDATTKVQIAFNEVMKSGPAIAGAYEAAMNTASKQIRSLKRDVTDLSEDFGKALTPTLNTAVGALRDLLHWLTALPDPVQATAVQVLAVGSGMMTMVGGAGLLIPKIQKLVVAFRELAIVQQLSAAGLLGPAGIVVGLAAAAAALTLYALNVEKAHRQEASDLATSTESYAQYVIALDKAGRAAYGLTEALYALVKAQDAAIQADYAKKLVDTTQSLDKFAKMYKGADISVQQFISNLEQSSWGLTDFDLKVLQDVKSVTALGRTMGKSGKELYDWVQQVINAAAELEKLRLQQEEQEKIDRMRYRTLNENRKAHQDGAAAIEDETQQMTRLKTAADGLGPALQDATLQQKFLNAAQMASLGIQAELAGQIDAVAKDAAGKMVAAEEDADEQREQSRKQMLQDQEQAEQQHADAVEGILEGIAQVDADLARDRVKADEQAAADRITAAEELARSLADADRQYDADREAAHDEFLRALEDLDRKYAQDVADLNTDLARDQEDMEREHLARLEELEAEHYARRTELAEEYNQKLASIEERYAAERKAIVDKYIPESEKPETFDKRRQALLDEYEKLKAADKKGTGTLYGDRMEQILQELEELKTAELAELDKRKQEELDKLAKWLADEQTVRDKAYADALAAEQKAYDDQKAQRQLEYDRRLADLNTQRDREKEAASIGYQQALADLQAKHESERTELQRSYQERLTDIDKQLAAEKARLVQAAADEKARLGQQLAEENQSYQNRMAALVKANDDRLKEIDTALEEEKTKIKTKAAEAVLGYLDEMKGLGPKARAELERQARDDLGPALDAWVLKFEDMGRRAKAAVENAMRQIEGLLQPGSPSKWALGLAKSIGEGFEAGDTLGDALEAMLNQMVQFKGEAGGLFDGVGAEIGGGNVARPARQPAAQRQSATVLTPPVVNFQPPALPSMGAQSATTITNERNYNLSADFSNSNQYPAIRNLFMLMEMAAGG